MTARDIAGVAGAGAGLRLPAQRPPAVAAVRGVPGDGGGRAQPQVQAPPRQLPRGSAANRSIGEVVQSRRRPLLGPSPG